MLTTSRNSFLVKRCEKRMRVVQATLAFPPISGKSCQLVTCVTCGTPFPHLHQLCCWDSAPWRPCSCIPNLESSPHSSTYIVPCFYQANMKMNIVFVCSRPSIAIRPHTATSSIVCFPSFLSHPAFIIVLTHASNPMLIAIACICPWFPSSCRATDPIYFHL